MSVQSETTTIGTSSIFEMRGQERNLSDGNRTDTPIVVANCRHFDLCKRALFLSSLRL